MGCRADAGCPPPPWPSLRNNFVSTSAPTPPTGRWMQCFSPRKDFALADFLPSIMGNTFSSSNYVKTVTKSDPLTVTTIATKPIDGQKPGTSGLRKKTKVRSRAPARPPTLLVWRLSVRVRARARTPPRRPSPRAVAGQPMSGQ